MLNKVNQEGAIGLFKSRIMLLISLNLFFQWYVSEERTPSRYLNLLFKARAKLSFLRHRTEHR